MAIEVQKIVDASKAMQEKLRTYDQLSSDWQQKQAVADIAKEKKELAQVEVLQSVDNLEAMLADVKQRHQQPSPIDPIKEVDAVLNQQ